MRGDSAYAELDAALLGMSIAVDKAMDTPYSPRGHISLATAFIRRDAMAIAAMLPSYTALNAWDMLSEISAGLEEL